MKRWIVLFLVMVCTALAGCGQSESEDLQQGENMQYFFSGEVIEAEDEYLRIEVNDIGNSNLLEGDTVEVSTDVVAADGCPEFTVGEYARVLLARNIEDSTIRLDALSVYKIDETGAILPVETSSSNVYSFPEPTTLITGILYSQGQETAFEIGSEDYDPNDLSTVPVISWFYDLELTACDKPEAVEGAESYDFYVEGESAFTYEDRGSEAYIIIDSTYYAVKNPSKPPIEETAEIEETTESEVVEFHGQLFNKSDLSEETLEWLEWYNSLSPEEQLAVSSIPADLYTDDDAGTLDSDAEEYTPIRSKERSRPI